ncbi:MAG: 30S ribosomal protein S4e [Promethearchaeota archaeon]
MARMGAKKHVKRLASPRLWQIRRKETMWAPRTRPGPHPLNKSIPLQIIIRDMLGHAKTIRETKKVLADGNVFVDGIIRKDLRFPVGLMDIIEIKKIDTFYRILPHPTKELILHEIEKEEAKFKLCQITNKVTVKKGNIQLNLHDGRNILLKVQDSTNPTEDIYKTRDVLQLALPNYEIINNLKFEEKAHAIIIGGKNAGLVGRINEIEKRIGYHASVVTLENPQGELFETALEYAFPIGDIEPIISLPQYSLF